MLKFQNVFYLKPSKFTRWQLLLKEQHQIRKNKRPGKARAHAVSSDCRGCSAHRSHQVFLLMVMVGNLAEKSLALLAIFTATSRASFL